MTRLERVEVLQAIFDCAQAVSCDLEPVTVWRNVGRREFLLHQGDHHGQCHIVVSGSADIRALGRDGQQVQIATVEPGEIFGCYPEPGPVTADVQAQNAMRIISVDTAHLSRVAVTHSEIGAGLARIFAGQLGTVIDRFAARVTLTATGRVYARMLKMVDEDGAVCSVPAIAALAVQAQTTRETASRAISALERRGILQRQGPASWFVVSRRLLEDLVI